jgi:pantoate--beta-alanine ligase
MLVCTTKAQVRKAVAEALGEGRSVGLVPTMGALHEGHISLVRRSVADNDMTVVSIFVNPTQFGPGEDLEKYPQTLEDDRRLCEAEDADVIFAPAPLEMYREGFSTYVEETKLSKGLCGAARPVHFRGVTTVVTKLFNIVRPDRAYFGQKDAQQAAVIKRMARDLDMPVEIVVLPIVREDDGVAMSSRNAYLSGPLREEARVLSRALGRAEELAADGETDTAVFITAMMDVIHGAPHARVDYVEIVDPETLETVGEIGEAALAVMAVYIGDTRLIDNRILRG